MIVVGRSERGGRGGGSGREPIDGDVDHEVHAPGMKGCRKSFQVVGRAKLRIQLSRIDCPVALKYVSLALQTPDFSQYGMLVETHMIGVTVRCAPLDIERSRTYPHSIESHPLDIVELGNKGLPRPTAVDSVGGVAWRGVCRRGEAIRDDPIGGAWLSATILPGERLTGRWSGNANRSLLQRKRRREVRVRGEEL